MKKIIVLGGAGFIGSHLVERLLADGNHVLVIDDFSVGLRDNLPEHKELEVQNADILDNIGYLFRDVDTVFHLAALTRPQESIQKPDETATVNVLGTIKILRHCVKYKVRRLVFVSSTSLYGEQDVFPTPETAVPNPMSPYALSKLEGEYWCKLYQTMYGLQVNRIRPFNVYGTRQSPHGGYAAVVPKFIDMLQKGETPFITGDGTQSRDFVYVEDVVDLLVRAAESEGYGMVFNAGSGISTSINDLFSLVARIMNKKVKPKHVDPLFEPKKTQGDISKAKEVLGWVPQYNLEQGLIKTIGGTVR